MKTDKTPPNNNVHTNHSNNTKISGDKRKKIDVCDNNGRNQLLKLCRNGHIDMLQHLLKHGASNNLKDIGYK